MDAYTIFLGIIQVFVLSSMFYVVKKYGKKSLLKYGAVLFGLVLLVAYIVSNSKENEKTTVPIVKKVEVQKINEKIIKDETIIYPKNKHICEFGMEFYNNQEYKKAYQVFKKGYEEEDYCSTVWYGTFYYNGIYVKKDYAKGGEIWMEAYDMAYDKFDADINYNVGIYQDYVLHNREKSRYHLAIAAKSKDKDAIRILQNTRILKDFDVSYLFFEEIAGFDNKEIDYDLIQKRFRYFENKDNTWEYKYYFEPFRYDEFKTKNTQIIISKKFIEISSNNKKELEDTVKKLVDTIYIDKHKSIYKTDDFIITKSENTELNIFKIKLEINYAKKRKYPPIKGKLLTNSDTDICENQDIAKIMDGLVIPRYCDRKTQKPVTGTYISNYFGYRNVQQEIKDGYLDGIEYDFDKNRKIIKIIKYKNGLVQSTLFEKEIIKGK